MPEKLKFVVWLLPYLIILPLIEIAWYTRNGRRYAWGESISSLVIMGLKRLLTPALAVGMVVALGELISPYKVFNLPTYSDGKLHIWNSVALFFALEFVYYWYHRFSHEIRWLWATHSVHHSSNGINFFTSARLSITGDIERNLIFMCPLLFLGFDAESLIVGYSLNLLYGFWIHTEMFPRLGPLEWILNTPSHHRIHHASNINFLDANYGGVLIIFDRMFGTFIQETDEPIKYGLVSPMTSHNLFTIVFREWFALGSDIRRHWRKPSIVLNFIFGPPGWSPDGSTLTSKQLRVLAKEDTVRS